MYIKRFRYFFFFLLIQFVALGQVTTQEVFPNGDNEITIVFDIKKAKDPRATGLLGKTSDVFLWSGAGSSLSGSAFQYQPSGQTNFSAPFEKGKMTPLGNDIWSIKIIPRNYYAVPTGTPIVKLGLLLKSGDGKNQTEDFVLTLFNGSLAIKWLNPSEKFSLSESDKNITIRANFSKKSNAKLTLGSTTLWSQSQTDSVNLSYTLGPEKGKSYQFVLTLESGSDKFTDSVEVLTKPKLTIQDPPSGIKDGITYLNDRVYLSFYAPQKSFVYVVGEFTDWTVNSSYLMNQTTDGNRYWIDLGVFPAEKEFAYQYYVDGSIYVADPLCDKILDPNYDPQISSRTYPNLKKYPTGAKGIVSVFSTGEKEFPWKIKNFNRPAQSKLNIYELLVRDFVDDKRYLTVADSLPYLKKLGINAIELMPVMEFTGNDSWGYNPIFYLAPDKAYGTKNDLKYLIDKCHENGMAVILDMVLNQADLENPYVKLYWDGSKPTENSPFFNVTANHPYSVFFDFNHESLHTQWLVDLVCQYWLTEYKMDGFRFDLSKGFTQVNSGTNVDLWGRYDASRIKLWKRIYNKIRTYDPNAYIILEHFAENAEEKELAENGMLLWANAKYDMTSIVQGYPVNFDWISYLTRGFSKPNLINYIESHDEERLMVEIASSSARKVFSATEKLDRMKMAAALFYMVPGSKMIWQFGELGYDISINQNGRTGTKPTYWNYLEDNARLKLLGVYQQFNNLRLNKSIFHTTDFKLNVASAVKQISLTEGNTHAILIANTSIENQSMVFSFPSTGKWYDYFTGQALEVETKIVPINLESGEFHLFVNEAWNTKNLNLVPWKAPNITILGTEKERHTAVQVFPNPATNHVNITWPGNSLNKIEFRIWDLQGRLILEKSLPQIPDSTNEFRFSKTSFGLNSGVYFIQIGDVNKKIVFE